MEWLNNAWQDTVEWVSSHSEGWVKWLSTAGLGLLKGLAIVIIGFWLTAIIVSILRKALGRTKTEKGAAGFICSFVSYLLKLIVIITVIGTLGVNITSLLTALGAAGITLGLALQDSLSNFASGVLILFNHPFRAGDYIEAEGMSGTVQRIELMYTVLLTPDNKEIVFPNSKLTSDKLVNYTAQSGRRMDMTFRVALDSDVSEVKRCLCDACAASSYVDQNIPPVVGINSFTADAIIFELRPWIAANKYWDAFYEMQELVLERFRAAGITIPSARVQIIEKP